MTIYSVYTLTPKGGFKTLYRGESLVQALKAYNKLISKEAPRLFNTTEGNLTTSQMGWGI